MKGLILGALTSASLTSLQPFTSLMSHGLSPERLPALQTPVPSDWYLSGQLAASCELQVAGAVTDAAGADLDLACAKQEHVMGNVSALVAAQSWRQRRITVSAEIKADAVTNAMLWLKTQRGMTTLMFDDDSEQNLLSTTRTADGWERRVITLPVAADATQVSFGVLVQGGGALAIRDLQLQVSQFGAMSAEAAQMLDAAIAIVKQQTSQRNDLAWGVLEPQLRLFAAGAQTTAEVYPAIKYLLSRLADKQSLLLTSEVAAALNRVSPASSGHSGDERINVFTLPDGARLVLSRVPSEPVVRTAQNPVRIEALP